MYKPKDNIVQHVARIFGGLSQRGRSLNRDSVHLARGSLHVVKYFNTFGDLALDRIKMVRVGKLTKSLVTNLAE